VGVRDRVEVGVNILVDDINGKERPCIVLGNVEHGMSWLSFGALYAEMGRALMRHGQGGDDVLGLILRCCEVSRFRFSDVLVQWAARCAWGAADAVDELRAMLTEWEARWPDVKP
jgi:hypothetical protein